MIIKVGGRLCKFDTAIYLIFFDKCKLSIGIKLDIFLLFKWCIF